MKEQKRLQTRKQKVLQMNIVNSVNTPEDFIPRAETEQTTNTLNLGGNDLGKEIALIALFLFFLFLYIWCWIFAFFFSTKRSKFCLFVRYYTVFWHYGDCEQHILKKVG